MKAKLTGLLLLLTLSTQAQIINDDSIRNANFEKALKRDRTERVEKYKVIGLFAASILLNAVGDANNDINRKTQGHLYNAASIGTLLASPFIIKYDRSKWYIYLISYTSLRIGLFDCTYNASRHLPLNYIGTTSITDKAWRQSGGMPAFPRGLCFTLGICLPIKEL
jgi:hypothetical protein